MGRTHNPAAPLQQALKDDAFANEIHGQVQRLAELARVMGLDVHIQTDYGIEAEMRTPWDLFKEGDAEQALTMAEEAVSLGQQIWSSLAREEAEE